MAKYDKNFKILCINAYENGKPLPKVEEEGIKKLSFSLTPRTIFNVILDSLFNDRGIKNQKEMNKRNGNQFRR